MRNDAVKLFYSKPEVFKQNVGDYLANVGKHYAKFAGYSNGWVDGCYRYMGVWMCRWLDANMEG